MMVSFAAFAPWIAPYDPLDGNLRNSMRPPAWQGQCAPEDERQIKRETGRLCSSWDHLLGTDFGGRDVLTRLIWGARVSIPLALMTISISATFGMMIGILSGYIGGILDSILMRIVDAMLGIPLILVAMLVIGVFGSGFFLLVGVIAAVQWTRTARLARGQTLSIRESDYVAQARIAGASLPRILFRHIMPNVINSIIVLGTLEVGAVILAESTLSFLGLGIKWPTASWGNILADGRAYVSYAWWLVTFGGVAIGLTVLSLNLLGDWIRDRLDPKLRQT